MISEILRKIPHFRGKQRIARFILKNKIKIFQDEQISAKYGCTFKLPNIKETIGFELFINGTYENDMVSFIAANIGKGKTLLDIGANIGAISIPIYMQRRDINIVCVEAAPWVFEYLKTNIECNHVDHAELLNFAISDVAKQEVKFYSPKDVFGKGSMASVFTSESVVVKTITIDEIVSTLPLEKQVDIIKIDVEGFEFQAFNGGRELLSQPNAPDIFFEFVDWAEELAIGNKVGAAQELLLSYGYRIHIFEAGKIADKVFKPITTGSYMLYATKRDI